NAPSIDTLTRVAPVRLAPARLEFSRLTLTSSAPWKLAPCRLELDRSTFVKLWPAKLAWGRLEPDILAFTWAWLPPLLRFWLRTVVADLPWPSTTTAAPPAPPCT